MGTVTPAHAAVAQLPLVLLLFVFLPDKHLHTAGGGLFAEPKPLN